MAAHSLGTSLALASFGGSKRSYERIHESYLYNPAYSPLVRGTADAFESDSSVRYFINLNDLVSMGSFGHQAPSNVVFRSEGSPVSALKLAQWQGSGVHTAQYHAPPETKVHAHKAVFGEEPARSDNIGTAVRENYIDGADSGGVPADSGAVSGSVDVPDVGLFDFGTDFEWEG